MRIFFATSNSNKYLTLLKNEGVENVLCSYAFFKSAVKMRKEFGDYNPKNLILDSGAFSVWTRNESIDIDAYAYFCERVKEEFPLCNVYIVNLDVLPGRFGRRPSDQERENSASSGWKNMEYLESKGLKVIPVFHQHEDFKWLDMMRKHVDYIGISPANDVSMPEKLNWLNEVFGRIKDTIKTHGFAVTSDEQLVRYPFFSVDSSSWTSSSRFGSIPIFRDGKIKVFKYRDIEAVKENWEWIKHIGIDLLASEDWTHRIILSIKSYLLLNKKISKLWLDRGVKYNE